MLFRSNFQHTGTPFSCQRRAERATRRKLYTSGKTDSAPSMVTVVVSLGERADFLSFQCTRCTWEMTQNPKPKTSYDHICAQSHALGYSYSSHTLCTWYLVSSTEVSYIFVFRTSQFWWVCLIVFKMSFYNIEQRSQLYYRGFHETKRKNKHASTMQSPSTMNNTPSCHTEYIILHTRYARVHEQHTRT